MLSSFEDWAYRSLADALLTLGQRWKLGDLAKEQRRAGDKNLALLQRMKKGIRESVLIDGPEKVRHRVQRDL